MANAIKKRLNRKGFTLAEVLVTVAILLILAGVTFVSVAQYQKNLRLMEMDGTAKEIFIAAQNHLSVAQASGDLDRLAEEANKSADGVTKSAIGTKLDASAVSAYTGDTIGTYYYMIHNATHGIESCTPRGSEKLRQMMLPFGALDETVATSGNYAIVYELNSASVVAVLYSGAGNASFGNAVVIPFDDGDVSKIKDIYDDKSARKSYEKDGVTAIVGCYTGTAGSAAIPTETLEAPKLEVKNENKLHAIVSGSYSAKDVITLTIHGVQSDTTAIMQLNCANGSNTFDITLDDITTDSTRFTKILSSGRFMRSNETKGTAFIPGENIEVSATVRATDALAAPKTSAVYTTSSLFADANDGRTVYIRNMRHLENLSMDMSDFTGNLTDKSGTTNGDITAIQKNDITMLSWNGLAFAHYLYGAGTLSDMYVAVNVNYPLSYDGGSHEIYDISIAPYSGGSVTELNAGIFGNVTNTLSVKNLILRNDKIPAKASAANAGMLLGKTSANLTVDGVLAYYHETEYSEANDSAVEVHAEQVAGGLIGLVTGGKLDVKNSAAAVYVKSKAKGEAKDKSAAGGFIGSVSGAEAGSTIVQSYAGGHTKDGAYSTTDATTNQPVLEGPGRYNVQASGSAGGFIGESSDQVSMNAVYATTSAYSDHAAQSGAFSGNTETNFGREKNYYAIGPHNGSDASADDTAKAQLTAGQNRRQATAYDRTLMGATETTAHPAMDKTSYPLNTIRHLCASNVEDKDLPWFIKEHVGDWVVTKKTDEPTFEVENGNRLTVRINTGISTSTDTLKYGIKVHGETSHNDVYFLVSISDTGSSVKRTYYYNNQPWPTNDDFTLFNRISMDEDLGIEFYLDDITQPQGHFYNTCPWLIPGEDISISVLPETNGNLSNLYNSDHNSDWRSIDFSKAETQKTNSIYGYLKEKDETDNHNKQKIDAVKKYNNQAGTVGMGLVPDGNGKFYVQIDNSRHLENLSENLGYPWPYEIGHAIVGAIQTDNIYWSGPSESRSYTIGFQEELGEDLRVYGNGNQLTQDGLFYPLGISNTLISLYDGSGFRISGLVAEKNEDKTAVALFVQPKAEMTVRNLILENVNFSITGSEGRAAGLIGYADHPVTIDNVHFVGNLNIKGSDISAGFVPQVNSDVTITNSSIENATISSSDTAAAGLVAYVNGTTTVDKVSFTGNVRITGKKETAGFIAFPYSDITITNSGIRGDTSIISEESEAGGIIGYVNQHAATVDNVKVTAKNTEIIAGKNAGGLIGNINYATLNISNVGISAFVKSNSKEDQAGAGGLIGRIGEAGAGSKIEKSYYGGRTTEGMYGSCTVNERTENEHIYGANVNGEKSTGGFIGYIGKANGLLIEKCFSTGSVNAESEAAGGFIGSSLGWCQGSISIKNCYSMGKVSGTKSSKGGFIGKSYGTCTFENVFYYSAFNTFEDAVGNQPGFKDISVVNNQKYILADESFVTANTHVYDMPTLEGETYPYKNWTTEHDDTAMMMVPTYYGDWPTEPVVQSYLAYYECYENGIGIYVPDVVNTLRVKAPDNYLNGQQKTGYGILVNTKNKNDVKNLYRIVGGVELSEITSKVNETDFNTIQLGNTAFYLWRFTDNSMNSLQWDKKVDKAWVNIQDNNGIIYDVNGNYGAAIAPQGRLGTDQYPLRIRNTNHHYSRYSNDKSKASFNDLKFVDERG